MKMKFSSVFICLFIALTCCQTKAVFSFPGCSDAGVADVTQDSICDGGMTTLTLAAYVGGIQWQSFDGSLWVNETGAGATTDNYSVMPISSTDFRAVVTDVGCPPDTSNTITVVVGIMAPSTMGDTRCGYGQVTLTATGTGTIEWYDVATGGSSLFTGPSFSTSVGNTKTFYAEANSGNGNANPLQTTFAGGNGFDGNMFDIVAINQVTITGFEGNLTAGTDWAEIWYRPGSYVGFNNSNAGWTFVDSVQVTSTGNGVPTNIPINVNVTIPAGQTFGFYVHFYGSVDYTNGTAVGNIAAQDANIQILEGHGGAYFALNNQPRIFNGIVHYTAGCSSARTGATATITVADSVSISASQPAICITGSSTLTVTSANPNYNYTWSPATGLSGTTGTTVTASPTVPTTYTVVGDDGTCGAIDSIFIDVGPLSNAGSASISTDTICSGTNTTLFVAGWVGNIQWQSNTGGGWTNETGPGNDSAQYQVSPTVNTTYWAVVTSGGCPPDTTGILSVEVITVTDPVTVNDTICGPGTVNLMASGGGLLNWYTAQTGGQPVDTGSVFSTSVTGTTTYYVETISGGGSVSVGPINNGFGSQNNNAQAGYGLSFDVTQQITLERVYVYSQAAGNLTINLRAVQNGPILNTVTEPINAFVAHHPINLGWTIGPGTGYRLEIGAGSPNLYYNTTGASFPYLFPGSPVAITGFLNPNQNTGDDYYYFYDWLMNPGCASSRVPVTGVVLPLPPVPTITQAGNQLTSSSPTNNQWYLNGNIIPGATNQVYLATSQGSYTVVVTDINGCSSESLGLIVSVPGLLSFEAGIRMYPNPVTDQLQVETSAHATDIYIYGLIGKVLKGVYHVDRNEQRSINVSALSSGMYMVVLKSNHSIYYSSFVKQ